jgi:hypothetical protein
MSCQANQLETSAITSEIRHSAIIEAFWPVSIVRVIRKRVSNAQDAKVAEMITNKIMIRRVSGSFVAVVLIESLMMGATMNRMLTITRKTLNITKAMVGSEIGMRSSSNMCARMCCAVDIYTTIFCISNLAH